MGGLARKATYIEQLKRRGKPLLIFDAGDLLFRSVRNYPPNPLSRRADLIVNAFNAMGCDAVNIGDLDLMGGAEYLVEKAAVARFPFLSANLIDKTSGEPFFTPYIIRDVADLKVGIFGLVHTAFTPVEPLAVADPTQTARKVVETIGDQCDLIIALTHLGVAADKKLAAAVPEINVIVGSHDGAILSKPVTVNGTLIVQAYRLGRYVGALDLTIRDGSIAEHKNLVYPLHETIASDPKIQEMITEYKREMAETQQQAPVADETHQQNRPNESTFVGESKCRTCHVPQHDFWKGTLHAHAYDVLVSKGQEFDPECIGCHTTGYRMTGGFGQPNQVDSGRNLKHVQCEVCHSAGSDHLRDNRATNISRKVAKSSCVKCHTSETHPDFDFAADVKKIACPPNSLQNGNKAASD